MNFRIKTEQGSIYLELPCREGKIEELCKSLGISNTATTVVTVDSVYLNDRANTLFEGKDMNLDKLHYLAKRLDSLDEKELSTFYAVAYGERIDNLNDLINLSFNTHCAGVVRDFSDLDAVGKELYLNEEGAVSQRGLQELNGAKYLQSVMEQNPTPMVTPYGIIYKNKNEFEQVYDGNHFPQYEWEENMGTVTLQKYGFEEYLYLPYAETALTKALERLGATSVDECEITLESSLFNDEMKNIMKGFPKNSQEEINSINHMAQKIAEIGAKEMPYLNNLTGDLQPKTLHDLDAIFESAYEFELFDGIFTAEDYGRYMICESGHFEYDENLDKYIDFEGYGSERLRCENGTFTNRGYIRYHGFNQDLSDMLSEIGIEIVEPENQTLKLYMPLKGSTYYEEDTYGNMELLDCEIQIYPEELVQYQDDILEAVANNSLPEEKARGLMKYYGNNDSVNAKVKRYNFSVENIRGKLMGVATLELNAPLDDKEMSKIKSEIEGQCSDGWGEGFEQREIKCDGRDIYVRFWDSRNWSLQTAEELGIIDAKHELTMGGM